MRNAIKLLLASLFIAALLIGCGTEEAIVSPVPDYNAGTLQAFDDPFFANYGLTANYYVYTPYGYDANLAGGYNTLYLLNGFGGNELYWNDFYKLQFVLDRLIDTGEIEPVIVVMPSGYSPFGGGFYTDSPHPAVGNAQQHILDLVTTIDTDFNTIADPAGRAIGGHSMGGYGAVSIVLDNPGIFGSVSALSAPTSFNGTNTPGMPNPSDMYLGIQELLPAVLLETGYADVLASTSGAGDATQYQALMTPTAGTVTAMMFAMSAAFSPTDITNPTATTIPGTIEMPLYVDIPLGIDGNVDATTWARWLAYDPTSKLMAAAINPAAVGGLGTAPLFMDCGLADDLGLYGAQQVFSGVYQTVFTGFPQMNYFNDTYYDGDLMNNDGEMIPADHSVYILESMERAVIWHNAILNP